MRKSIVSIAGYDEDDPEVVAADLDVDEYARLVDRLIRARRAAKLTQHDVARRMGTSQSAISDLERAGSDPRLSTLMRYATAIGAPLRFRNHQIRALRPVGSLHGSMTPAHTQSAPELRRDAWQPLGADRGRAAG